MANNKFGRCFCHLRRSVWVIGSIYGISVWGGLVDSDSVPTGGVASRYPYFYLLKNMRDVFFMGPSQMASVFLLVPL